MTYFVEEGQQQEKGCAQGPEFTGKATCNSHLVRHLQVELQIASTEIIDSVIQSNTYRSSYS